MSLKVLCLTYLSFALTAEIKSSCSEGQWQCASRECINSAGVCDGHYDCYDLTDENEELCANKTSVDLPKVPYVENGYVSARNHLASKVAFQNLYWEVTCSPGYMLIGLKNSFSLNGRWMIPVPQCIRYCVLKEHPAIKYNCRVSDGIMTGIRPCREAEPVGTVVEPKCQDHYYSEYLADMTCTEAGWNASPVCKLELISSSNCSEGQWQCASRECINSAGVCDGHYDCYDHTDESEELCANKTRVDLCEVPYVENGNVSAKNHPASEVGQAFQLLYLEVTCSPGYMLFGLKNSFCINGTWMIPVPQCIRYCVLKEQPAIKYNCRLSGGNMTGTRPCREAEPVGTVVEPKCQDHYYSEYLADMTCTEAGWNASPVCKLGYCVLKEQPAIKYNCRLSGGNMTGTRPCREAEPVGTVVEPKCQDHYYSEYLADMTCTEAGWNHSPICKLDCGTLTPGQVLSIGSRNASRSEVPWHVGIYRKKTLKKHGIVMREQICGGSLISYHVLISAAHCFHNNVGQKLPESHFSVAVGKLYRLWDDPLENPGDAQMSEIKKILIPKTYHSESTYYQSDIAVVEVTTPFQYRDNVKPVCLDFDHEFDERQINSGALGKVAGWGYLNEEGVSSPILKIVEEPIYNRTYCYSIVPTNSKPLITYDKICAGYTDGSQALCLGDSGGGLAVKETRQDIERYYLRGVVSATTISEKQCNRFSLTYFTRVAHHKSFILQV